MIYRNYPLTFGESATRLGLLPVARFFCKPELMDGSRYIDLERPCFLYGNHSNNFDPFMLNHFIPWGESTRGVITKEYHRGRLLRKILMDIDLQPTRKHVPEPHLIREIYRMIAAKYAILIYPEGGRRWDGRPTPWIESTAKVFVKSGLPIYPVVTHGSYVGWPRWATYPRRTRMRIEIKPPLQFDRKAPLEQAVAALKAHIAIDETIIPDDSKPYFAYRPAQGIQRLLYRDPVSGANGGVFTPDGTYVVNAAGTFRYKMLKDSTMLDEKTGEIHTTATLYDQVRALPLERDASGAYIRNIVAMHTEDLFPRLDSHGTVEIALYPGEIRIKGKSINMTLPLEDALYTGIERNTRLQITLDTEMIQFTFDGDGSALQWEETIQRLKAGASPPAGQPATA